MDKVTDLDQKMIKTQQFMEMKDMYEKQCKAFDIMGAKKKMGLTLLTGIK